MVALYFERQVGALCGQHALNNALQGPYVTLDQLSEIAEELDEAERALMLANGAEAPDALRFLAEGSSNVDESGNFSEGVLREALRLHGVGLKRLREPVSALTDVHALLANRGEHWFALRRLSGAWWNLDSLSKRPARISDFFFDAFVSQLQAEGQTVFALVGTLPPPKLPTNAADPRWVPLDAVVAAAAAAPPGAGAGGRGVRGVCHAGRTRAAAASVATMGINGGAGMDPDLAAALKASLESEAEAMSVREALATATATAASGVADGPMRASAGGAQRAPSGTEVDEDEEFELALALSMGS